MVDKTEWSELWMKYDNELNPYIPRGVFLVDLHDLPEVRWFNKNRLWTCINETLCVIIFSLMFVFLLLCNHRYLAYFLSIVFLMPLIALVLGLGNSINAIITTIMLFIVIFKGYKTDMKLHISCSVNLWLSLLLLSIVLPSTLTSTLLPSNGYGVYGGKAHLFFAMQQIPKEYFTVKVFSVLQPGYPLGFPMLIYYIYCIIGEPTEWFIKFISCLFYIGSFYMIISQVEKISIKLFVLSFFLSDVVVNLATMFYSECIILFVLLLAWRLLERKCSLGWFILGLSAWIKIEAIFFVPILYIVKSIIDGNRVRVNKSMIYGVLPFVVWMIYSRCFGAKVYDYANFWEVDLAKLTQAFAMEAKLAVFKPWNYSWMYIIAPLLSIYCFINKSFLRCYYRYVISSLFVLVSFLIVISYIFSLSRAVNFDWHLQCMARLLVVPSAFSLMLLVTSLSRNNLKRK